MLDRHDRFVIVLIALIALLCACTAAPTPVAPTIAATLTRTSTPSPTRTPTPTPTPAPPKSLDPTTLIYLAASEPDTLDPHIDYTLAGSGVLQNIYEGLITVDGADLTHFVPLLAESIPEPISADDGSVTYTWRLKRDIKFQNGEALAAEDVAYSFWRAMLIGTIGGEDHLLNPSRTPGFLLLDAFFGVNDAAQLVDTKGLLNGNAEQLRSARRADLRAACQQVKDAVTFDNVARTITLKLRRPYAPLLPTLAGPWAYVVDKQWLVEHGEWDGDCQTWQLFYGRAPETGFMRTQANGTGPYQLDHWTPGVEMVLTANTNFRSGEAAIKQVTIKYGLDVGARVAQLRSGAADLIDIDTPVERSQLNALVREECQADTGQCATVNTSGRLRVYRDLPSTDRANVFFNFALAHDSPYAGSGQLDGQGVPLNFFANVHVRRAFNYCFDAAAYSQSALGGAGLPSTAITLPDQPGYDGSPGYPFDLSRCAAEFKAAELTTKDGRPLWDSGLTLDLPYLETDVQQQALVNILVDNLTKVNANFKVKSVALSAADFEHALQNRQLPLVVRRWQEDLHDPHNWYAPYLMQTYTAQFDLASDLSDAYAQLIDRGVAETEQAARAGIYRELNQRLYDDAVLILLPHANRQRYEPTYLKGWRGGRSASLLVANPGCVYELSER